MKNLIFLLAICSFALTGYCQSFVSPIGFEQNDASKESVLAYIRKQVKADCAKIGMDDPSTLRLMEQENLKAFKELITVTNVSLLKRVIKTYCEDTGICDYQTLLIMYNQENKDSQKKTEW